MSRPTPAQRGYGRAWQRKRERFLAEHPTCALCPEPSRVPDHYPRSRRQLIADGAQDPDASAYLRPLCERCHNRETAARQPGGWNVKGKRKRERPRHPGLID